MVEKKSYTQRGPSQHPYSDVQYPAWWYEHIGRVVVLHLEWAREFDLGDLDVAIDFLRNEYRKSL